MSVTIELLDSMLAPRPGHPSISSAESHYHSIPLSNRVRGLNNLLAQLQISSGKGSNNDAATIAGNVGRTMLAAVLLRRDVATLAGPERVTGLSKASALELLGEIAEPLMNLFFEDGDGRSRRQIGHCVAELCCSLSVISLDHGKELLKVILNRLEPGCVAMDLVFLRLLSDISERSPCTLWSVGSIDIFSSLFRTSVEKLQQRASSLEQLEASMGALCEVGIAYEKAKRALSTESENEIEKAVMAQFPAKYANVDPKSPVAHLGRMYLPTMLEAVVTFATHASTQVDILSNCMSHLSACSSQCPSLLAGDETSLASLMRGCMSIAQINSQDDEDITFLRLSALDVLATIVCVPQIKQSILQPNKNSPRSILHMNAKSPLLQFLIQGNDTGENSDQRGVLYLCVELIITSVDDDEESWSMEAASMYDSESAWENDYSASLLESFVENLGGANTLPFIFQLVDMLLTSSSWQNHRAALSMLERCLAAAPVTFVSHIPATVETALRLIQSSNTRVQYQALQLLGSLCCANSVETERPGATCQQILVRENYGGRILEVVSHLTKSSCTKVASHACLTLVSYCRGGNGSENCLIPIEKVLILPFIGELLSALRSGPLSVDPTSVSNGSLVVLIRAIGAVACLADASGEDFLPHYSVISGLKSCILSGLELSDQGIFSVAVNGRNNHDISLLRGAAIEASSIVGQAVSGPDGENVGVYLQDASEIMKIAGSLLEHDEIIPMDQLLNACARIAAVMGSKYVPFMPMVLPCLLKRAAEKIEVSITDDDCTGTQYTDDSDDGTEGYTVSIPGMGVKKVKINTIQLEEKAQSARAVYEHARALGVDFGPFVESSANAFLPLVHCEYSGEVRSTSSQALSQIFKSACMFAIDDSSNSVQKALPQNMLPALAKSLTKQLAKENDEDDIETRYAIADALSEVMYDGFTHKNAKGEHIARILASDAREIVSGLMALIQSCLSRRSTLLTEMTLDLVNHDEIARCQEKAQAEADLLTHLVDSVGYQIKWLRDEFSPIFDAHMAGPLGQFLTAGTVDVRARFAAICLFDDCIEHCGSHAASAYSQALLQAVLEGTDDQLNSGDADLKQASVYGVAQIARHAPKSLSPEIGQKLLMRMYNIAKEVETVRKSEIENIALVEIAISSMASLALLRNSPLFDTVSDKKGLLQLFLCGLPLEEDYGEAQVCHEGLCDMVESNMINLQSEFSILIKIIGGILALVNDGEDVASQSTCSRLVGILDKIQQTVDDNSLQMVFSSLPPNSQHAIAAAMQ